MNEFIASIKSATSSLHIKLEDTPISKKIVSPEITREEYALYLSRILSMHKEVEAHSFPIVQRVIRDTAQRIKTNAVQEDLHQLEYSAAANIYFLDTHYSKELNFNLGLMYVTEGSVLGGQFILKNIKNILGQDIPAHFLNVYGQHTGTLWKSFLTQLQEHESILNQNERDEIIAGAKYGFERAYSILK